MKISLKDEEKLIVRKIKDGTVIDHIPAGRALVVLKVLGITGQEGNIIALVMNVESKKLGKKDIIKIEGRELKSDEVNKIALIAPNATINIIKDYRVVKKMKVQIPDVIEGLISCVNPNCISNQPREPIKSRLKVISREPLILQCEYCGRYIKYSEVLEQLLGKRS